MILMKFLYCVKNLQEKLCKLYNEKKPVPAFHPERSLLY